MQQNKPHSLGKALRLLCLCLALFALSFTVSEAALRKRGHKSHQASLTSHEKKARSSSAAKASTQHFKILKHQHVLQQKAITAEDIEYIASQAENEQEAEGSEPGRPDAPELPTGNELAFVQFGALFAVGAYNVTEDLVALPNAGDALSDDLKGLLENPASNLDLSPDDVDSAFASFQPFGYDRDDGAYGVTYGFAAVTTDGKTLHLAFRGTADLKNDGKTDASALFNSLDRSVATDEIMSGFEAAFSTKCQAAVDELLGSQKFKNVVVSGHSLGGALATVAADYILKQPSSPVVTLVTLASPRTGTKKFVTQFNQYKQLNKHYRVVVHGDPVPRVPSVGMSDDSSIFGDADKSNPFAHTCDPILLDDAAIVRVMNHRGTVYVDHFTKQYLRGEEYQDDSTFIDRNIKKPLSDAAHTAVVQGVEYGGHAINEVRKGAKAVKHVAKKVKHVASKAVSAAKHVGKKVMNFFTGSF